MIPETIPFDPTIPVFVSYYNRETENFTGWCYILNAFPKKAHLINGRYELFDGPALYYLADNSKFDGSHPTHTIKEEQYCVDGYVNVVEEYYFRHPKVLPWLLKNILNL